MPRVPILSTRWHCVGAKGSREAAEFRLAVNDDVSTVEK